MCLWQWHCGNLHFCYSTFRCTPIKPPRTCSQDLQKGSSNFVWSHQIGWKTQCSTTTNNHTNTLNSQYDVQWWYMFCLWTSGSFWLPLPQCTVYSCNEFGHFAQDCPNKIPPPQTPYHQDRSHSRYQYTHTQRNRPHSTHYGHRHGSHSNHS